jgi:hypothetical protein
MAANTTLDEVRLSGKPPIQDPDLFATSPVLKPLVEEKSATRESEDFSRSFFEQFIASFFQEKNIRWMLVVGAAIVFGSSLMLVTREWSHWTSTAQFFTILGYTAAIYGFSQLSRHRLGLLATAKVLDLLTLLLLPVSFLSLSWLTSHSAATSDLRTVHAIALMVPAAFLTWFASKRIFDDWLRGRQTTFLVSYVVLCVAGAFPVIATPWLAASFSLFLWLVMTVGVIKVNRHVFWLVEEYRSPRVFGFLPVGLLGSLFVLLVASKTVQAIPFEWLGLGCTAVAATILLTGRSVANVFRQRTGDLVRPLPWNILVPLLMGVLLTIIGVLISFHQFSYLHPTTIAVVPTTFVAALLMLMVAQETKHSGFVWAGLVLVAICYQTTPTLATELVQQLKSSAAHALAEQKLPLAFYGLTYLPLLTAFSLAAPYMTAKKRFYFSMPLQQFATVVAVLLFATSFTHTKAIFPVATANVLLFTMFAVLFRDRRYIVPSLIALVLSAGAGVPFGNSVGWFDVSWFHAVTSLGCLACFLVSTRFLDRFIHRIPYVLDDNPSLPTHRITDPIPFCQYAGLSLVFGLAIFAVGLIVDRFGSSWSSPQIVAFTTILLSTFLSAIRIRHYLTGLGFWVLSIICVSSWILGLQFDYLDLITIATLASTVVSLAVSTYVLVIYRGERYRAVLGRLRKELGVDSNSGAITAAMPETKTPWPRSLQVLVVPLGDLCFAAIIGLTAFYHLPMLFVANATNVSMLTPVASSVSLAWLMVYGMLLKNPIASVAAFAVLPLWTTAMANTLSPSLLSASMLPLIWSAVAGVLLYAFARMPMNEQRFARLVGQGWLAGVLAMGFFYSDMPMRCAGLLSLGLLAISVRNSLERSSRTLLAILANAQILLLAALLGGVRGWLPIQSTEFLRAEVITYLLPVVASSILFFDKRWSIFESIAASTWSYILRIAFLVGVLFLFEDHRQGSYDLSIVESAIIMLAIAEFCEAVRYRRESQVWTGIVALAVGGIYLAYHGVIIVGAGASQFVMLACSIACLFFVERSRSRDSLEVFVRPLRTIGLLLPGIVVVSAILQSLFMTARIWTGWNTLALLAAACIYFQMGMVTKRKHYYLASGAILNITLSLLWHTMQLYDFQLYLVPLGLSIIGIVELLRAELPEESRDPIRYLGALTILVSPLFEILNGSWLHLFSLMVLSVLVILLSIGLRLRVLVYTGSAFLMADMVAMVIRTTIDHPGFLWVGGLGLGVAVIALAAICERHREHLLERIRFLSNELAAWH